MTNRPTHPEIMLVMARATNGVIGDRGRMPWHIPADLRHFKMLTMGLPMVMGRKTFDALPGILEGRRHIVMTRDPAYEEEGVTVVHSREEALKAANGPLIAVIGGGDIYSQFIDIADRIELTEIEAAPTGDTLIPYPDPARWQEVSRVAHPAEGSRPAFSFVTFRRKPA